MTRFRIFALTAPLLALAACSSEESASNGVVEEPSAQAPVANAAQSHSPTEPQTPSASASGVNDGYPDLTPARLTPAAERTEKGARNVLLSWARAIELKEFDQAWSMLGARDKQRWSKAQFAALFDGVGQITVAVPSGTMEGAAGSSYYTVPITITAEGGSSAPLRIEGPVVLKRVNDVPGATAEQLRWHIDSADLSVTH